ncbi:hypothetical protein [Bradyrhizobium sp.]|jgi:hypothetical protein|uniref:hypothetical protein n=1 Tax=Bradyrhizobium sp. TaxID=376 RepID=UPI003D142DA5
MLQFTEKIPPPRHPETFDDSIMVDAASQKLEKEDHWVREFIANLAAVLRRTGK